MSFEPYPLDRYPISALRGEMLGARRQASIYRKAAESEDLHAALFEAEIARREAREASTPPPQE